MYGSTVDEVGKIQSDEARIVEFEARIKRGEKIEPGDWMPDEYRQQLIRMISQRMASTGNAWGILPPRARPWACG